MKLDIPYYIRQVLREQRMVNIPGIGILRLVQTKATFNDDKKTLNPPSLTIEFDENSTEDDSLLKYILDTGELSEPKARKRIEQYNQAAFNKVLNVDAFQIEGVGVLSKKVGEDGIIFTPSISELTQEYQKLAPIKTTPISRLDENSTYKDYTAPLIAPPRKESDSYFPRIILFVALILAAFFIWKY
ncbi:MAG: hypothetical protein P1U56_25045, partial [Saprospiraceae bacterium]|nr:hypothetical protein [Saprospiraceae bacterium]